MRTVFLLMNQFNGRAVIPLHEVCAAYFPELKLPALIRSVESGKIPLPVMRFYTGHRVSRGVHLQDLADYVDKHRAAAVKERNQLCGLAVDDKERDQPFGLKRWYMQLEKVGR